jgi:hypothetical protein
VREGNKENEEETRIEETREQKEERGSVCVVVVYQSKHCVNFESSESEISG